MAVVVEQAAEGITVVSPTDEPTEHPIGLSLNPRCPMAIPECRGIDPELRRPVEAATDEHRAACIRV